MSDSEVITESAFADREVFYSKSDEKFTVRSLLDQLFSERVFDRALDVGPGEGHITEPLARRAREIILLEPMLQYAESLAQRFPNARIVSASLADADLPGKFDLILFSHVLYYQPEETWLETCRDLLSRLSPDGELLVILNSDHGDWWRILQHYTAELRERIPFHYTPLSQFKRELADIASVQAHSYRYQMWIEPGSSWTDFIGRHVLEISDERVLSRYAPDFAELANRFKKIDGSVVVDCRAEILRLRNSR